MHTNGKSKQKGQNKKKERRERGSEKEGARVTNWSGQK